jgi:acyl-CoA reductase-like NAD-dependent aldehyde dehydrogenase
MTLTCFSPVDNSLYAEFPSASLQDVDRIFTNAAKAQAIWRHMPLHERAALCTRFVDAFVAEKAAIALELTWQMGRPIAQTPGEVRGLEERARYMIGAAELALQDVQVGDKPGFTRFIRREPLGVVLTIAAWNYPYLIAVNSVIPALMAGNAVVLKHSAQTPLCAERFLKAFQQAGLPENVFQVLHADHATTLKAVQHPQVAFVAFTGSTEAGRTVQKTAAERFIGVGLELGGKDPAYVRSDANLNHAIENLVDGSFFNSGQSCCAVERIYVHHDVYAKFVDGFVALTKQYKLGNPTDPATTLGPVIRASAAAKIQQQIAAALQQGAQALIDPKNFQACELPYLAPQVLVNVDHTMAIMTEETFGPAVGIMQVESDEHAVTLMNDSRYGLTASIWTQDANKALEMGNQIVTGTCFMNRCDYLDPALAWVGVKDSGRGYALSTFGYEPLTRPKSFHLRHI